MADKEHITVVRKTRTGWKWICSCGLEDYAYDKRANAITSAQLHEKQGSDRRP